MLTLLSPAKKQTFDFTLPHSFNTTPPSFSKQTKALIQQAKTLTEKDLQALMSISPTLANLNAKRFQQFDEAPTQPALFAFQGDVYQGLDAASLPPKAIEFAQDHLAILSGLYGLLRPLDQIRPHRLEMGINLTTAHANNLYEFWGTEITQLINQRMSTQNHPVLINLASQEYFKSIQPTLLKHPLIHIEFKEHRDGRYLIFGLLAKRARGKMARFIVSNAIDEPEALKSFNVDGYQFTPSLSESNRWVFVRGLIASPSTTHTEF
jgi:cytoplasmic iron level regulating protein YaaA (DUF328/UPF0246 family)